MFLVEEHITLVIFVAREKLLCKKFSFKSKLWCYQFSPKTVLWLLCVAPKPLNCSIRYLVQSLSLIHWLQAMALRMVGQKQLARHSTVLQPQCSVCFHRCSIVLSCAICKLRILNFPSATFHASCASVSSKQARSCCCVPEADHDEIEAIFTFPTE